MKEARMHNFTRVLTAARMRRASILTVSATLTTHTVVVAKTYPGTGKSIALLAAALALTAMFSLVITAMRYPRAAGAPLGGPGSMEKLQAAEVAAAEYLARQLHSTAVQDLLVANHLYSSTPTDGALPETLQAAEQSLRRVIAATHTPNLHSIPLGTALDELTAQLHEQSQIAITWTWDIPPRCFAPHASILLAYRFIHEALSNVVDHSGATHAQAVAILTHEQIILSVSDNGRGFDTSHALTRAGLGVLNQRAAAYGARITLSSAPGAGTSILLRIPVDFDLDQTISLLGPAPASRPFAESR